MTRDDVALAACVGTLARELIAAPLAIDALAETINFMNYERSLGQQRVAERIWKANLK